MIMSSDVIRKAFVISRFAEKLLPLPGVPSIKPLGLLSRGTFLGWGNRHKERAQNAPVERLKPILGVVGIKPLPALKTGFWARQKAFNHAAFGAVKKC